MVMFCDALGVYSFVGDDLLPHKYEIVIEIVKYESSNQPASYYTAISSIKLKKPTPVEEVDFLEIDCDDIEDEGVM